MLQQITLLLVCQLAGEALVRLAGLPVPGPVVGMVLLLALLFARGGPPAPLQSTAEGLLGHLSLLFVPAGVGVVVHLPLIAAEWPAIVGALVVSTVLTVAVTAWLMAALLRRGARGGGGAP